MTNFLQKAYIHTLGCRLNSADTALLNFKLLKNNYTLVKTLSADVSLIIINSCCVTAEAGRKSAQFARKARKECPFAKIIFTGCAARVGSETLSLPQDVIVSDKKSILVIFF